MDRENWGTLDKKWLAVQNKGRGKKDRKYVEGKLGDSERVP